MSRRSKSGVRGARTVAGVLLLVQQYDCNMQAGGHGPNDRADER
jgi:hypothetical protein